MAIQYSYFNLDAEMSLPYLLVEAIIIQRTC